MNQALEDIVRQEVEASGLELFDLKVGGARSRPVLDVRIERPDRKAITVDDCARVSRAVEARLDERALVGEKYILEVSSPGVERPLRHAKDWARFAGEWAAVTSDDLGGSRDLVIRGIEGEAGQEVLNLEDAKGAAFRIQLAGVKKARLVFHWKR
ncbi:MAG: ribosome maturation factor RimP [Gemmatimonadaceae bacterium]|nr:ribosome maturation factor RimP [Gemmatimonadaceae bacterium]